MFCIKKILHWHFVCSLFLMFGLHGYHSYNTPRVIQGGFAHAKWSLHSHGGLWTCSPSRNSEQFIGSTVKNGAAEFSLWRAIFFIRGSEFSIRRYRPTIPGANLWAKFQILTILTVLLHISAWINLKFGADGRTICHLLRAKFHITRCNLSPLWGEKTFLNHWVNEIPACCPAGSLPIILSKILI